MINPYSLFQLNAFMLAIPESWRLECSHYEYNFYHNSVSLPFSCVTQKARFTKTITSIIFFLFPDNKFPRLSTYIPSVRKSAKLSFHFSSQPNLMGSTCYKFSNFVIQKSRRLITGPKYPAAIIQLYNPFKMLV